VTPIDSDHERLWGDLIKKCKCAGRVKGQFILKEEVTEEGVVAKSVKWNSRKGQVLATGSKVGYHHMSLTGRFGGGSFG
jgi:hypothetical protein